MTTAMTWDDGYAQHELTEPDAGEVEARLVALDGKDRTLVMVYRGDGHLAVGGSATDGLVVYYTADNEVFWQLVSDCHAGGTVTVVAGGQSAAYLAHHVTTLGDAIAAATEFLRSGCRAGFLRWELQ